MKKCSILISIKPKYADLIYSSKKIYEFRTKRPKSDVGFIIIYWTFPRMKILAKVEVKKIIEHSPETMWKITKQRAGIDKKSFFKYFEGRKKAYAFVLGEVIQYKKPKKIIDFGIKTAPQSFIYLK